MPVFLRPVIFASAVALFVFPVNAHAGFQWTAPAAGIAGGSQPPAAPLTPIMADPLPGNMNDIQGGPAIRTKPDGPASAAPIYGNGMTDDPITWNTPYAARNQNQMNAMSAPTPRAPVNYAPSAPTSLYTTAPTTGEMSAAGYGSYEVADGFGRDLPLVMAIRQIVPSSFGFIFDDGIDVNANVSWQGGKPWDVVLQETLAPLNLTATIRGNVVTIARRGGMQTIQAGGPAVLTETVLSSNDMAMSPLPVSTISGPAASDDMMAGGYTGVPASTPPATLNSNSTWTAPRNSTLRGILEDWSSRVGVELYWASEYDYPIQSAVNIGGTFEEAVQVLLKGLSDSRPRPLGRLHPNLPEGPAILVIETHQNSL